MAISSVYVPPPPEDWRARLKEMRGQAYSTADQGMVAQPYADPGNAMPFVQAPSQPQQNQQEVKGWLSAGGGGQNALMRPGVVTAEPQQNQLGPLVSDARMADIIRRLYIAATGGYHDGPLFPEQSPYPPLAPYDRGRPPIANERPGPIPNMTVDDFRRGFDATPRDDVDWWLRSKLEPREADI